MENYLTLELPYLEFDTNVIYDHNLYDKDGVYFVKDKAGIFHLVEVDKSVSFAGGSPLPASVCYMLIVGKTVSSLDEKFKSIDESIGNLSSSLTHCANMLMDHTTQKTGELDIRVLREFESIQEQFEGIQSKIQERPKTEEAPSKGYISEEALVEIIKNVRK